MTDQGDAPRSSLLQSAMEEFIQRTRSVAGLVGSVGSGALGAMPEPVPATVAKMLKSLQHLIDQAPPLTEEISILIEEIHAQRLTLQALQAEMAVFDHQLEVLERSLAPLETWTHQWARLRQSLTETLYVAPAEPDKPAD